MIEEATMEYLTVNEAAQRLRVHRNSVYKWLRTGQIEGRRFGRVWRIAETALHEKENHNGVQKQ